MNTKRVMLAVVVIIIAEFLLDGLWHGMLMKSFYDAHTPPFFYPAGQEKVSLLFLSEITLFGSLVFFVSRSLSSNSLLKGMLFGGLFCLAMGSTFALVNFALMPGRSVTTTIVQLSWSVFQGAVAGAILVMMKGTAGSSAG